MIAERLHKQYEYFRGETLSERVGTEQIATEKAIEGI
jgi:hypothetical protein